MDKKRCYFCEAATADEKMYIFEEANGKRTPIQVAVCEKCKKEYESTYPGAPTVKEAAE